MTGVQCPTVVAVFDDPQQADRAIDELHRAGFANQIGAPACDPDKAFATDTGTHATVGAASGAAPGASIGGLVALGILAGVNPGTGPAIAAGAMGVSLANAAGRAAIAGISGALAPLLPSIKWVRVMTKPGTSCIGLGVITSDLRGWQRQALLESFSRASGHPQTVMNGKCSGVKAVSHGRAARRDCGTQVQDHWCAPETAL